MKRPIVALLALVTALAGVAPAVSAAEDASEICSLFPHSQTYREDSGFYRAPAWRFGRAVTVRYTAASCDVAVEGRTTTLIVDGTAFVYERSFGTASVAKDFSFSMTTSTAAGEDAWPVAWWDCTRTAVDYRWTIAGVYDFSMRAREGDWFVTQRSLGRRPLESSVTITGCSS